MQRIQRKDSVRPRERSQICIFREERVIEGIDTNVDYQYGIVNHPDYIEGNIDIEFIERL